MAFKVFLTFFTFVLTTMDCNGEINDMTSLQSVQPQMYCGRSLARVLALLCSEMDNYYEKRSGARNMYSSLVVPYQQNQDAEWPRILSQKAKSLYSSYRGKRTGIISECCEKPCSINELLSYC